MASWMEISLGSECTCVEMQRQCGDVVLQWNCRVPFAADLKLLGATCKHLLSHDVEILRRRLRRAMSWFSVKKEYQGQISTPALMHCRLRARVPNWQLQSSTITKTPMVKPTDAPVCCSLLSDKVVMFRQLWLVRHTVQAFLTCSCACARHRPRGSGSPAR